jgi:thioredoxin-dependent peroxiredoxin
MMTQTSAVRLSAGLAAPTFKTQDIFDNPIDLQAFRGRPVLLSFYRNAACAMCNLRIHEWIRQFTAYAQSGLALLAVFESPRENMLQYVAKQDAPFPLIADPGACLYDLYGVEVSEAKVKATMADPDLQARVQTAAQAGFALTPEEGSNFHRMPAEFLIDPAGIIRHAYYADLVGQHLEFDVIDSYLAEMVGG